MNHLNENPEKKVGSGDSDESRTKEQLIEELEILREREKDREKIRMEQSRTNLELRRAKRALKTLSFCHKAMVGSLNKEDLLQDICRIIVEEGGYTMAWVGLAVDDEKKSIKLLAKSGNTDGYFENINMNWSNGQGVHCPEGTAIRTGKPFVVKDILSNPNNMFWRGEALKQGFSSVVSLPLISNGHPFGALSIYSSETHIFNNEEVDLLKRLADNLVFGVVAIHTHKKLNWAEGEAKRSLNKLRKAFSAIIQVLEKTVEIRDPYTAGHQRRVADLAQNIAREMDLSSDRIDGIKITGIIHDIGKIHVPAEILSKPRALTSIEFNLIKTHPQVGADILKAIEFPWPVDKIVLQHHERMDGSGYPNGLSKRDILLEARILGVADVVEAMASHRPYRPALGIDKALKEISDNRGILYDKDVVDICLKLFREKKYRFEN
ncbi:MAG: HD domain-containing phosphohydrolase [Acidobacteriota bacterium]